MKVIFWNNLIYVFFKCKHADYFYQLTAVFLTSRYNVFLYKNNELKEITLLSQTSLIYHNLKKLK